MRAQPRLGCLAVTALLVACSGHGGTSGDANTEPVALNPSDYTYSLTEATSALPLFTTPTVHRLTQADRGPTATHSGLRLSAARREFEPVQLAIGPATGRVTVVVHPFEGLGESQRWTLAQGSYEAGIIDELSPVLSGDSLVLSENAAVALWLTVYVPPEAPAGDHETTLELTREGDATVVVPVRLHVFDFALTEESHFGTQFNLSVSSLIPEGGAVDDAKNLLFEHRLTPTSATWPSGFNWAITWENENSTAPCEAFWDEPDEGAEYSIRRLAARYLLGEGWNGVGFRDAELFQFVDNATPRPPSFCGISRGDHYGTDSYNAAWSTWLSALDGYLVENGYAERGYYYVQNEPQNEEDHALAAHLCRLTKAAAPHLRIAVSEEPKPEIAEDPGGACGYDIWIAHVRAYQEDYAWRRQSEFGETVWFYSLDHDPEPYFNPTVVTNQGLHERIIPWAAFSHRIRGWAYYDGGRFFPNAQPSTRVELLREGLEDYEYLWLANGSAHPSVDEASPIDATVRSVAASMTSWTRDSDAFMALRDELGRFLGGETETLPTLVVESSRPRGDYYLNFQDPAGEPRDEPLVVDGHTFLKVGWDRYDPAVGYGFIGEFIDDDAIALYGFDDVDGYSVLEQSYLYDDYGRDNLFEFDLAPGRYELTVTVGRPGGGYPNDPHQVSIEGQRVIDDEPTTDTAPILSRTVTMDIADGSLSMVIGGRSASTGEYAYTFLSSLRIVAVDE